MTIMQIFLALVLFSFPSPILAGGYHGCLERVLLFQAYEIDELNPESTRQIGFGCKQWSDKDKECRGDYKMCVGSRPNKRCNFDELVVSLGGAPRHKGWEAINPATGRLDTQQSAVNCFNFYTASRGSVPNFPPFRAMNGNVYEFNDYVLRLSTLVNDAFRTLKTDNNRHLWDDFDETLSKISNARVADHGRFLIKAAEMDMQGGIRVQTQNLGDNPATGAKWETVDWAATVQNSKSVDPKVDVHGHIRKFLDDFYHSTQSDSDHVAARHHYQVLRTYKRVTDRTINCRKQ